MDKLSKYDDHIMTCIDWLNDNLVNAAQNLLFQVHSNMWFSNYKFRHDIGFQYNDIRIYPVLTYLM